MRYRAHLERCTVLVDVFARSGAAHRRPLRLGGIHSVREHLSGVSVGTFYRHLLFV